MKQQPLTLRIAPAAASAVTGAGGDSGMTAPAFHLADYYQVGDFWTNKQRQGHSINEISYRACFKPQLPLYFIERLTRQGDIVLDPFMGRGTTAIQAALLNRIAYGSDINPLSKMLTEPRLCPPTMEAVAERFRSIPNRCEITGKDEALLVFYHPDTLRRLLSLRKWFLRREQTDALTGEDAWIRMVLLNRLSGHSDGFLSVKTMPPNQAVSIDSQRKINRARNRKPEEKDILKIILKKSASLLRSGYPMIGNRHKLACCNARRLDYIQDGEVDLVVTSPPFLNVVDYAKDNWLRCWFAGIDPETIAFDDKHNIARWGRFVRDAFVELARVVKRGGYVAFEVGEVRGGSVKLENHVIDAIKDLPFVLEEIMINAHSFTKTANCWGVENNTGGTLTNRIVVMRRE